jgi:tRNA pseudouridine55 synthase
MNGVIIIDKPVGISSFDVIRRIKKVTSIKKIGHTGTLDPLASGVLPICIGKATKLSNYLMSEKKTYRAELKLGVVTDTYDREGKILEEKMVEISEEEVTKAIMSFVGEIQQVPPMYSALKINGKRLYELARQGIEVEREKRNITIFNIDIISMKLPYVCFDVECSKGTYIRSLCYDIGEKLNVGGCMWNLRRTASGHFNIDNSIELDKITKENFLTYTSGIEDILSLEGYEKIVVNEKIKTLLSNGVKIKNEFLLNQFKENKRYMIYYNEKEFLGLAIRKKEELKMEIQF